uniref:PRTase-CE domain-containing protein n=1 Tax=Candidatus Kentrum sp. TUN TaxID=2126343 RepID=A0A451AUA9_9GAMM|nr:MAG: hypothetical protein BECKTUN1418F_GA0071002_11992 [Candidatus Kentron sp. TUN]VFK69487.1 MAG: hypothetical protein BECKTUN1418E_GA0071001_11963 [Candidatus Kentron sp. TUN]
MFLALNAISQRLEWDDETAKREFAWLELMARLKYDEYRDFLAGARFLERLAAWLGQFETREDRKTAYDFVKNRLVFISTAEINRLVELFYHRHVHQDLLRRAANIHRIPPYKVMVDRKAEKTFRQLRRKTLFMGLSDGARIDLLRRTNVGRLNNEQVVLQPFLDDEKWRDLAKELQEALKEDNPKFETVYVLDDFTASGTSLIRRKDGEWKGKLERLWKTLKGEKGELGDKFPIDSNAQIRVHHYMTTKKAHDYIKERLAEAKRQRADDWFDDIHPTYGLVLDEKLPIDKNKEPALWALTERYYDSGIESEKHMKASGDTHWKRGYGQCALPLVLEHNTPNNSLALLWAESSEHQEGEHLMRPLFYRRQRHT